MVSNMERNVKRFNEKCKRNYITIITVEYQCGTEMEGDILISASDYRSRRRGGGEGGEKLYVNCLIKGKKKKKQERQSDATLMTKYYSIRCRITDSNRREYYPWHRIESDTKQ